MDDKIPAHWQPVIQRAGFESARQIGLRAGIHTTTIMRLLRGEGRPSPATVDQVRKALHLGPAEMAELMGRRVPTSIEGPPEFGLLSRRQQQAVVGVIRAMIEPERMSDPVSTNAAPIDTPKRRQVRTSATPAESRRAARRGRKPDDEPTDDR